MNASRMMYKRGDVHAYVSGKSEIRLMNRPGSESVGYGLKRARTPMRRNVA